MATIDPLGNTHTVLYDSRGRAIEQVAASGTAVASKTKTIYDAASRPVEVQSPRYFDSNDTTGLNTAKTTMTYTGRGLLASRTESPGTAEVATESYTYNIEGRQLTRVDARGQTWTNIWSTCCGRQQGAFDPYGNGTIVNVDGLGRATHTATVSNVAAHSGDYKNPIDAQTLQEVTTKYDSRGRVTARTVWLTPLGTVDPANPPIYTGPPVNNSATPPAAPYGLTTTYAYDDNLTDTTGLDATFSAHLAGLLLGADSDGAAVLTTNPAGERGLSLRDGLGRNVRSVQLAANNTALVSSTSTFDTIVNISGYGDVLETASANALGHTNKSRTDGAGRTLQSLDATNAITTFVYNANGQRLSVRDPNNVGQDCTYDTLGRDLSCTDTAGAVTSRTYDLSGNVKTQTDAKGKLTSMVYDSRGRRTTLTDRIAAVTAWVYDAAGNELSMTDAENQTTVYGYDNSGRRTTIQWPDHVAGQTPGQANYGIETTAYDPAGRPQRKTNQLGDTITSVYDLAGRLTKKEYRTLANSPAGTIASQDTFTFDAASRMLTGVRGLYSNTVALAYDAGGRKATEALTIAGQTYTTGTAYDTAGRVSQLTYPDGSVVARTYDSRNLLSTIALGGGNIDSRSYDAGGRLISETLGNGQVVTRGYLTGDNLPALIGNANVGAYTYGWDANKNKTSETITGAMSGYGFNVPTNGYDDQNRLTAWNRTNGTKNQAWALSSVGDWNSFVDAGVTQARTHGPTHEILTIAGATVTHDSRGNMTQDELGKAMTWDADGMLASATVPAGSSTGIEGTHTYQYDALGRRVRKTTGGAGAADTVFVRDSQTVVAEYAASQVAASSLRKYVNASYVDEPVLLVDRTAAGSVGAGTDERFYYHRNQQYSITALTDNSGTPVERYAYTAYGEPSILDGAGTTTRTTSFIGNPYLYTAQEYDPETALYHFNARMYEGRKGRFLSHDPIGYPDGYNTYAGWFAIANTDPFGFEATTLIGGGLTVHHIVCGAGASTPPGAIIVGGVVVATGTYYISDGVCRWIWAPKTGPDVNFPPLPHLKRIPPAPPLNPPKKKPDVKCEEKPKPQPERPKPPQPPKTRPQNPDECDFYYAWCTWGVTQPTGQRSPIWDDWGGGLGDCSECWTKCKANGKWPHADCPPDGRLGEPGDPDVGPVWKGPPGKNVWPDSYPPLK